MMQMEFKLDLAKTRANLKGKVLVVQKKISMEFHRSVVNMTPVDTGRARGNWFVTLVAPRTDYDWNAKDPTGGGTISAGAQTINALQDYGAIYLTNNLPYIVPLEKGHSKQAPAGMVRLSFDRVAAGLR